MSWLRFSRTLRPLVRPRRHKKLPPRLTAEVAISAAPTLRHKASDELLAIGEKLLAVSLSVVLAIVLVVKGPVAVFAACIGVSALVLGLLRLKYALFLLVLVNLLAVARAPLPGGLVLSDLAQSARPLVLVIVSLHALWYAFEAGVPTMRLLAPTMPLLLVAAGSVVAAPSVPAEWENIFGLAALLAASAILAWPVSATDATNRSAVLAVASAFGLVAALNVILAPLAGSPFAATDAGARFTGILENPNSVGLLGFAGVPLLFAAAKLRPVGSATRAGYLLLAALLLGEVFLSGSRAGLAGTAAAAAVLFVGLTRHRMALRIGGACLIAGAAALAMSLTPLTAKLSELFRFTTLADAGGRRQAASLVLDEVRDRPFVGHGYGSSRGIFESFGQVPGGFTGLYAGNVFLDAALEIGLIGILALLIAFLVPLRRTGHIRRLSREGRLVALTWTAVAVGGLVNAQGESFLVRPGGANAPVFWFSLAVCSATGWRALTLSTHRSSS